MIICSLQHTGATAYYYKTHYNRCYRDLGKWGLFPANPGGGGGGNKQTFTVIASQCTTKHNKVTH